MSRFTPNLRAMPLHDQIALGSGVLVFVASFFPWHGAKITDALSLGVSGGSTTDAWHGLAAFGLILSLLALVVTAAELLASDGLPALPISYAIIAAGFACLGALFVVIKTVDLPTAGGPGFSVGLRWGGWALIVLIVAQAVISVLRVVHAGDSKTGVPSAPPEASSEVPSV